MKKLLISLADFADYTAFSTNIAPALVEPYIREAQTFDVKLPAAIRVELEAELEAVAAEFRPEEYEEADFATTATVAGWKNLDLARVWYEAIRPLLVLESARHLLMWHGLHITPNAAEITTDRPISSQQRAELRADLQAKASHYRPLFDAGIRSLTAPTTPAPCGTTRRRPSRGGFKSFAV